MSCSVCKHPGYHTQVIPLHGQTAKRCTDCPYCEAERRREDEQQGS